MHHTQKRLNTLLNNPPKQKRKRVNWFNNLAFSPRLIQHSLFVNYKLYYRHKGKWHLCI